jgi:hypothetical protein
VGEHDAILVLQRVEQVLGAVGVGREIARIGVIVLSLGLWAVLWQSFTTLASAVLR